MCMTRFPTFLWLYRAAVKRGQSPFHRVHGTGHRGWVHAARHHVDSLLNLSAECDSVRFMRRSKQTLRLPRESLTQTLALIVLLVLGAIALAGPSGVLAWTENAHALEHNNQEIARLTAMRDRLHNRVELLDPRHADPDLVGELLRRDLNVAHPDEVILPRK